MHRLILHLLALITIPLKQGKQCTIPEYRRPSVGLEMKSKKDFYAGFVVEAIVKVVQDLGRHLTLDDLKQYMDLGSQAKVSQLLSNLKETV